MEKPKLKVQIWKDVMIVPQLNLDAAQTILHLPPQQIMTKAVAVQVLNMVVVLMVKHQPLVLSSKAVEKFLVKNVANQKWREIVIMQILQVILICGSSNPVDSNLC